MAGKHEKKKEPKEKRKGRIIFIIGLLMMFAYFGVGYLQYKYHLELLEREYVIQQEIDEEKKKSEELEKRSKYNDSEENIEKIAREQLGLVKSNEIMFVDRNK